MVDVTIIPIFIGWLTTIVGSRLMWRVWISGKPSIDMNAFESMALHTNMDATRSLDGQNE